MQLEIKEFVVRHRTTGKVWFRCICINDQDNYVDIEEALLNNETVEENNLAAEFNDSFAGHRNVRYLSNTKNFVCGTETTITEHTVAELATDKIFVVMANYDEGAHPVLAFRNEAAANEEAAKRNLRQEDWAEWNQMLEERAMATESVKSLQAAFTAAQADSKNQSRLRKAYEDLEAEKNRLLDLFEQETPFQSKGENYGDAYHQVDEILLL
mgnify:CR=1 FL=1